MKKLAFATVLLFLAQILHAQNYQAIHGSTYAGSLGIYNNPASGIHSHFNWDLTLFSVQSKSSTNSFTSTKSLLSLPEADIYLSNGDKQRYVHLSQDVHLLNGRVKLNQRKAIAFGFNTRNYIHIKSKSFKFIDTISNINSFLKYNRPAPSIGGKVTNNTWAEIYASYSQVLRKTNFDQLSAGITLKAVRGLSGIYLHVDQMNFKEITQPGSSPTYVVTDPNGKYGYSSNYDKIQDNNSSSKNENDFLAYTQGSLGFDLGVEYLIKSDYAPLYDDEAEKLEYNWKIGLSVLDLGKNLFKHGKISRQFNGVLTDVTEEDLENKFSSPGDLQDFYDSLETVVQQLQSPGADFYIWQPTRLVINIDRPIGENFFINGELSINLFSTHNKKRFNTREINMLTITPRYEKGMLGLYLPVQLNTQGQLWIGSAFKAGPLLVGIHDWRWLISKNKVFNGGAYIALIVRNFFSSAGDKSRRIKNMDCPPFDK